MTLFVIVIVTTVVLLFAFARVFRRNRLITKDPVAANDGILKALATGSNLEVKEAIADTRIKVSVIQMQHLGLATGQGGEEEEEQTVCSQPGRLPGRILHCHEAENNKRNLHEDN